MAPSTVRMVLVEGENGDGATVDEDGFPVAAAADTANLATSPAVDQTLAAIMGTRQSATEGGYRLASTGVTWTDPAEAGALRDALAAHKLENVMLVSAFLSAAALAQSVGTAMGYTQTGLLFVESDSATLAVVDTADGSVADVRRELLPADDSEAVAQITAMAASAHTLETRPQGLFVVGSDGVDVGIIKPELEAATSLVVSTAGEPETALARGAALAAAHAPIFESSTAALAYAQDPGTGEVHPELALAAGLAAPGKPVDHDGVENHGLAYSADPDDEAGAYTAAADVHPLIAREDTHHERKPFLVALGTLTIFVVGVAALAVALALDIRPHVSDRPNLGQSAVAPAKPAPPQAPAPAAPAPAAPAPAPAAPAPAPAAPAPPPLPAAPPPLPAAPPQIPIPAPRLPAPGLPGPGIPGFGGGHGGGDGGGHGGGHGGGDGGIPGIPGIGGGHGGGGIPGLPGIPGL